MGTVNASSYMEKQEIAIVGIWFGIEKRFCSCHTVDVIGKVDVNWDTVFNTHCLLKSHGCLIWYNVPELRFQSHESAVCVRFFL